MTTPSAPPPARPARVGRFDGFSVGMYATFLLWDWLLYSFGPVIQILGGELRFSAAEIGLHGTALAVGTGASGLVLAPTVRALGRRGALLLGAALVAVGGVGLAVSPVLLGTMASTLVLALGGNVAIAAAQAGLVVHHGINAPDAVSTANGLGTLVGLFGPLLIGISVAAGFGWRPMVLFTVPLAVGVIAYWLRMPPSPAMTPPAGRPAATADRGRRDLRGRLRSASEKLPTAGWWFLLAALLGVAIENAMTFWSLTLLTERTGATAAVGAVATAAFVGGMASLRLVSWWFTARWSPVEVLLGAFALNVLGWLVLWLATAPVAAIIGLAVAGMGCGLLYPMAASLMLGTARGSKDSAQGLIMVAIGAAVAVTPLLLGILADGVGVHTAFLLIPALAAAGAAAAALGALGLRARAT